MDEDGNQARARREREAALVSPLENEALRRFHVKEFERESCSLSRAARGRAGLVCGASVLRQRPSTVCHIAGQQWLPPPAGLLRRATTCPPLGLFAVVDHSPSRGRAPMEENLGLTLASTEAEHPMPGTQPPARETATGSRQARSSKEGGNEAAGEGEHPQYAKTQRRARSSPTARAVRTYCPPPSPQAPRRGLALVLPCGTLSPPSKPRRFVMLLPSMGLHKQVNSKKSPWWGLTQ